MRGKPVEIAQLCYLPVYTGMGRGGCAIQRSRQEEDVLRGPGRNHKLAQNWVFLNFKGSFSCSGVLTALKMDTDVLDSAVVFLMKMIRKYLKHC